MINTELLVLTALASEAETLLRGAPLERDALEAPGELHRLALPRGREALAGFTGMGAAAVRRAFQRLEERGVRPRRVVFGGFAGALRPELAAGDLLLLDGALGAGGTEAADRLLVDRLARALEDGALAHRRGVALEVSGIRGARGEKRELAKCFPEAHVSAMEDLAAIRAARALGAEIALVRVVLDALDDWLPDLSPALDGAGRPRRLRLAAHLASRPGTVLALPALARSFGRARATLDRALRAALELA